MLRPSVISPLLISVCAVIFALALFACKAAAQGIAAAAPPPIAAKAWLLLDYRTRRVIVSRNADERIEPASLTKLMTAYLVFGALKQSALTVSQLLPVSAKASKMPGSRMFIESGRTVSVDELLRGMIVQSGNDATIALAEGMAGSEE